MFSLRGLSVYSVRPRIASARSWPTLASKAGLEESGRTGFRVSGLEFRVWGSGFAV